MNKIVLIDDDELIHHLWKYAAKLNGVDLVCFFTIDSFIKVHENFAKNTHIYIDAMLGEVDGISEAQRIYKLGFENLVLATGLEVENYPDHFTGVQGKEFPLKFSE